MHGIDHLETYWFQKLNSISVILFMAINVSWLLSIRLRMPMVIWTRKFLWIQHLDLDQKVRKKRYVIQGRLYMDLNNYLVLGLKDLFKPC